MFERVPYDDLNSRQKENYNFQKVAARLADYGFNCLRLSDDWQGADFIACHIDGETFLKIQLKGRLTIDNKYFGRGIHIAFLNGNDCYIYPHDETRDSILARGIINESIAWAQTGAYSWPTPPAWAVEMLSEFRI